MDEIYKIIVWSFEQLAKGFWPKEDFDGKKFAKKDKKSKQARTKHAGEKLMEGWVATWSETRGD